MKLLHKIKEKGLAGCINFVKIKLIHVVNYFMLKYYAGLPVDENSIVLESEGDCCDNAYALFDYMKSNGYLKKYKVTWLVDHPENYEDEENVKYVQKNICGHFSPDTIKALRTCRWYIYDHCDILGKNKRKGQSIIFLNHGAGFKAATSKPISYADETYTLSPLFFYPSVACWGCPIDTVTDIGFPRLDYLFKPMNGRQELLIKTFGLNKYSTVFLWMPTFRKSSNKSLSEDYFISETGLPIMYKEEDLEELDKILEKSNAICVFKIHHLQAELSAFKKIYSNIVVINDEKLKEYGVQLYEFVSLTSCLITDYSSISTDYMLLDRPIIYTMDDYEEYKSSRGFSIDDPAQYFVGHHARTKKELENAIIEVSSGIDIYREERNALLPVMHSHVDGNAAERILEHLEIKTGGK